MLNLLYAEGREGLGLSIVIMDNPTPAISAAKEKARENEGGGDLVFVDV